MPLDPEINYSPAISWVQKNILAISKNKQVVILFISQGRQFTISNIKIVSCALMSFSLLSKEIINNVAYNLLGKKNCLSVNQHKNFFLLYSQQLILAILTLFMTE